MCFQVELHIFLQCLEVFPLQWVDPAISTHFLLGHLRLVWDLHSLLWHAWFASCAVVAAAVAAQSLLVLGSALQCVGSLVDGNL
jgi:hypothetical protein